MIPSKQKFIVNLNWIYYLIIISNNGILIFNLFSYLIQILILLYTFNVFFVSSLYLCVTIIISFPNILLSKYIIIQ